MKSQRLISTACLLVGLGGVGNAQWTVTNLHPAGATSSVLHGVAGNYQFGYAVVGGRWHASIWTGNPISWTDLHPGGPVDSSSSIEGSDGSSFVGWGRFPNESGLQSNVYARIWKLDPITSTILNPNGSIFSSAYGVKHPFQVGVISFSASRAAMWAGSSTDWTSLHPTGVNYSHAYGIAGNQQVGYVGLPVGGDRASLWTGSADSWVNLHPGSSRESYALATSGRSQVGHVYFEGNNSPRASLWYGSAESWMDLTPDGESFSSAKAVSGSFQVGYVGVISESKASLWSGSANSWVNLHEMLNPIYSASQANGVYVYSDKILIAGYAENALLNRREAMLWSVPIQRISGDLFLQDTSSGGINYEEQIAWILQKGSIAYTGVVNVNQFGGGSYSFEIPIGAPNGAYTLQFKGGTFLSSTDVVNLNGNNITRTFRLRNGDIDQDGEVGPGDFEAVVGQFGGPGNADADNDGEVGPSDFEIVVANFGLQDQ